MVYKEQDETQTDCIKRPRKSLGRLVQNKNEDITTVAEDRRRYSLEVDFFSIVLKSRKKILLPFLASLRLY